MTMRLVACEFCQRLHDFQTMNMCPVCRKSICRRCQHDGALKAGQCARAEPCSDEEKKKTRREGGQGLLS